MKVGAVALNALADDIHMLLVFVVIDGIHLGLKNDAAIEGIVGIGKSDLL